MRKILVINSGSSSIKLKLFLMPSENVEASALIERIGQEMGKITFKTDKHEIEKEIPIPDHETGLKAVAEMLLDKKKGVISHEDEILAVGHRVVHGGSRYSGSLEIDEGVKKKIKDLFDLAPLHNPPSYKGIVVSEMIFPKAKQIAVFDTAFHQSIPTKAHKYAIPNKLLEKDNIQVYGFHGISHKYVADRAIEFLKKQSSKIITIHLGNGCSMTAVQDGRSYDTSMGFSPASGLIMGTRSGDLDYAVIFHMIENIGYTPAEVNEILQKQSGMLGLTGYSDLRDIEKEAMNGNHECKLALEMNAYRIKKYIGAYIAAMNGVDAIVFTAGIGENSDLLREMVCSNMSYLGIQLEPYKNKVRSNQLRVISKEDSRVTVLVIPTNEELEIANQAFDLL
ncbi:acetate/propionate family kinase [Robertkochia solimangrovi]|uniref:acetate/propionate family kinase n=1 Tax=Robertkochia solimangrovi TaxID=2213046 RepID=UPI00117EABA4|nr:acetate kinase [Robertkochia solimangrovi]TRZ45372.1 acetate kinase [Robertkochia solimangrovi]